MSKSKPFKICGDIVCDGWHECPVCEGEGSIHNCGEDCCPCLDPDTQDRVTCQRCNGKGGFPCPPE